MKLLILIYNNKNDIYFIINKNHYSLFIYIYFELITYKIKIILLKGYE